MTETTTRTRKRRVRKTAPVEALVEDDFDEDVEEEEEDTEEEEEAAPKVAPKAAPKAKAAPVEAKPVKRGRGRPRKTDAEKAASADSAKTRQVKPIWLLVSLEDADDPDSVGLFQRLAPEETFTRVSDAKRWLRGNTPADANKVVVARFEKAYQAQTQTKTVLK